MNMILIKRDSKEWNLMWEWLASHPLNEGLEDPAVALNKDCGEQWQYMGSYGGNDGSVVSEFRHRAHPLDGSRKYLKMKHYGIVSNDDIDKTIPIK